MRASCRGYDRSYYPAGVRAQGRAHATPLPRPRAALPLHLVQEMIGRSEEHFRRPPIAGVDRHAHTRRDAWPLEVAGEAPQDALPHAPRLRLIGLGEHDRELIPAEAGGGVHLAAGDV